MDYRIEKRDAFKVICKKSKLKNRRATQPPQTSRHFGAKSAGTE